MGKSSPASGLTALTNIQAKSKTKKRRSNSSYQSKAALLTQLKHRLLLLLLQTCLMNFNKEASNQIFSKTCSPHFLSRVIKVTLINNHGKTHNLSTAISRNNNSNLTSPNSNINSNFTTSNNRTISSSFLDNNSITYRIFKHNPSSNLVKLANFSSSSRSTFLRIIRKEIPNRTRITFSRSDEFVVILCE